MAMATAKWFERRVIRRALVGVAALPNLRIEDFAFIIYRTPQE